MRHSWFCQWGVSGLALQENTEQNPQRFTTGALFSPPSEIVHCVLTKGEQKKQNNEILNLAGQKI